MGENLYATEGPTGNVRTQREALKKFQLRSGKGGPFAGWTLHLLLSKGNRRAATRSFLDVANCRRRSPKPPRTSAKSSLQKGAGNSEKERGGGLHRVVGGARKPGGDIGRWCVEKEW